MKPKQILLSGFLFSLATTCLGQLRDDWIDSDTGHRVIRLSKSPGKSESFYFHQNAFTRSGDKMVFFNNVTNAGSTNEIRKLALLNWKTKSIEPLVGRNVGAAVVAPKSRAVFYFSSNTIYSTHLDTHATKTIAELPKGWRGLTVNADETLLAGAFGEGAAEISRDKPRSYWFNAIFDAKLPHLLFTVEIKTGRTNIFFRSNNWLNHMQFSPTDPKLLMFCHEGPWHKLDRIWNIRTDGSGLKLMHERTMPEEIAGHEFWQPDGKRCWFDLQMPRGATFFIAGVDLKSGKEIRYPLQRDEWSVHFNISHDGKIFAGDGGGTNMIARAQNGKWIRTFTPQKNGMLRVEKLFNMAAHDYALEPNVNFTPDDKWIVFRGNFEGIAQVYAVEVAKAK